MVIIKDYPRFAWQLLSRKRLQMEIKVSEMRKWDVKSFLDFSPTLKVLDLANGRLRPQYNLLKSYGFQVTGIDFANRPENPLKDFLYKVARWIYVSGIRINKYQLDTLVCGDVSTLPFRNNSFDLISSVAAFEHFLQVPRVVSEIFRVLRPGGMAWIAIHPFSSLSGGHNLSRTEVPLQKVPSGIQPWDHLRKRKLSFSVPLNEWRIADYLECFSSRFEILKHYCAMREGEHLLTPEIEAELTKRGYTREELTCGAYVIVARKPGS